MKTIKFRAKNLDGEWVCGFYVEEERQTINGFEKKHFIVNDGYEYVKPDTVGQFTGLCDKDGKEIYEGDIVLNKEIGGYGIEYVGVVRYYEEDCRFGIDTTNTNKFTKRLLFTDGECSINDGYCTIKYCNEYEVLGNIFDNPELLKSL